MRHPFRFGVVSVETASGSAWTEFARRVEALGYAVLWSPTTSPTSRSPRCRP